jgi:hypothetical protein
MYIACASEAKHLILGIGKIKDELKKEGNENTDAWVGITTS